MIESSSFLSRAETISGTGSPYQSFALSQQRRCRIRPLRDRADVLDHIGDQVRVGDDDLAGKIVAEIRELRKHLVGRPKIQFGVAVGVLELHTLEKDLADDLVLGVQEVRVAGGNAGFAGLFRQRDDLSVQFFEPRVVLDLALRDEEAVVRDRLDLEIVVERGDLVERFALQPVEHGAEDLAGFARRTDDQPLAVVLDQALRHPGDFPEIVEITVRDQLIQIF